MTLRDEGLPSLFVSAKVVAAVRQMFLVTLVTDKSWRMGKNTHVLGPAIPVD